MAQNLHPPQVPRCGLRKEVEVTTSQDLTQCRIDRAVSMATKAAMNGNPVERIVWVPATSATQDAVGSFAVMYAGPLSASDRAPWD